MEVYSSYGALNAVYLLIRSQVLGNNTVWLNAVSSDRNSLKLFFWRLWDGQKSVHNGRPNGHKDSKTNAQRLQPVPPLIFVTMIYSPITIISYKWPFFNSNNAFYP